MKKLIELRQQKNALKNQMRSLLEKADSENRSLNAEEGKQFDELRAKADALDTEISRLESVADEERSKPGTGIQKLSSDELRNYIVTGDVRSLSTSTDSGRDGGYTVIPELDREVMRQLQDDSVMRVIATVKTAKSNEFQKLVSTGGATVGRGTEGSARSETNTPKIERVTIKLNPIYAYPKTTQEILDFSEVDILGWLSSEIADTFASTEEDDFVNGDGNGKPKGFMAYTRAATSDKTRAFGTIEKIVAASGTAITADELIDILYKLKAKYRKNAVWVMNSGTAGTLQKLKNENGDYIWRDSLKEGAPDMLLGRPVYCLESMPDIGAGKAPLKANPNIDVSVDREKLASTIQKARGIPSQWVEMLTKRFNIWCQGATPWMGNGAWAECAGTFAEADLYGQECYAGLDLSSTSDISSVCYAFPVGKKIMLVSRHYLPEFQLQNPANKNRAIYRQWVKAGWIRTTPGDCIDYDRIRDDIMADAENFNIRLVGFDTWNATHLRTQLQGAGFEVEPFPQTYLRFSPAAKSFEVFVNRKVIVHRGDPVLAWSMSNVVMQSDANANIKPNKKKSSNKIDPSVAALMAFGTFQAEHEEFAFDMSDSQKERLAAFDGV